jgi:hypothetical protein
VAAESQDGIVQGLCHFERNIVEVLTKKPTDYFEKLTKLKHQREEVLAVLARHRELQAHTFPIVHEPVAIVFI